MAQYNQRYGMRRDYFELDVRDVDGHEDDGDPRQPTVSIDFYGPAEELRSRFLSTSGDVPTAKKLDVSFRLQDSVDADDARGVVSMTDQLTGDYVLELNARADDMLDFIRAACECGRAAGDGEGRYRVDATIEGGHFEAFEKSTFLVCDGGGTLLRSQSLIPSGVELWAGACRSMVDSADGVFSRCVPHTRSCTISGRTASSLPTAPTESTVRNVTDCARGPFNIRPSCGRYVPGYGNVNADFHVIGDHPGIYGGIETDVPFAGGAGEKLFPVLEDGELLGGIGDEPIVNSTFFSYLHICVPDDTSSAADYTDMEHLLDAELHVIAAHVLLPVGAVVTKYVLNNHTSVGWKTDVGMEALHGEKLRGSGFLVLPIKDPAEWDDGDHDELVAGLLELQLTDFRREFDLGRFVLGADLYLVR